MSLFVTRHFYIQNARNFEKPRKFALCFYIQKDGHFALHNFFIEFLKLGEGGGGIFMFIKQCTLRYIFK